ncbi:DUF6279 family lipoprotein [Marinobacter fonticola]|uniref:DUF6279 family lipoprotein n=1 Tax=Marinobacter fonticola TaxID=2603215 RepID=UPI0011E77C91|nr:DUF6279 family lipoprotein [Marinobacter fonticola]
MFERVTLQGAGPRALGAVMLTLLLAGCSSTQLAYRQLDWALVWWVEDYIPLDDVQEARLESQINSLLEWHCRHELPRYAAWLEDVNTLSSSPPLHVADVERLQAGLFQAIDRLTQRIHPTATALLGSLSNDQVAALDRAMAEGQRERREEFLGDTPAAQLEKREERTRERAERWLGSVNANQRQTIKTWNRNRGKQTEIWLEGRGRWQAALLQSLQNRSSPGFPDRIEYLLTHSSDVRGETYQTMFEESRAAMTQLIVDLINQSTPQQRAHLEDEIEELQADFEALACRSGDKTPATAGA